MTIKDIIKLLPAKKEIKKEDWDRDDCPMSMGDVLYAENAIIDLCISALSKITDKESEYRVALEAIIETMAQPIDRISNVDVISYGALRKIVLDIATKALSIKSN